MTDTYIWQKVRKRFLETPPLVDENENETEIIQKEYDEFGEITAYINVVDPNDIKKREDLASKDNIWFEIHTIRKPLVKNNQWLSYYLIILLSYSF